MKKIAEKTSTWLALRNPIFRKLWLATVVSGSCVGAHNTAVYWALDSLGASTVIISLMATVSALPYTVFTLPAGAIADMVDRKKILLAVQLWHATIAFALPILWMAHLLNPYLILASAFLFSAIQADPELRNRFQFWVFAYPTGNPIALSALRLRESLAQIYQLYPRTRGMILIGHSMGGLLAQMQAVNSGRVLWNAVFQNDADRLYVANPPDNLVKKALIFDANPHVKRIVFGAESMST